MSTRHDHGFGANPEPRCPLVLLLDNSGSMQGERITALNAGLQTLYTDLNLDLLTSLRAEVALVSFNSKVEVVQPFITVQAWDKVPPELTAAGATLMGTALNTGLDLLDERKRLYRQHGIQNYRPWLFLITDGKPEHEAPAVLARAKQRIADLEGSDDLLFFSVGVGGADFDLLKTLGRRPPQQLKGLNFQELFLWLSESLASVSHSQLGDKVRLGATDGWAEV